MTDQIQRMRARAAKPLVWIADGAIYIRTKPRAQPYEIALSSLSNEALLLGWIFHLCDKVWFTKERCQLLIQVAHDNWGKKVQH